MPRMTLMLILTLAGALGTAWADSVYRWVDSHGEVHYSDQWVPGATLIMTNAPRPPAAGADAKAMAGIAAEDKAATRTLEQDQAARAVAQDEAAQRAKACQAAKARYQQLIQARRLFTQGADGERHYLSDAQADAERVQAREAMDSSCGTPSGS